MGEKSQIKGVEKIGGLSSSGNDLFDRKGKMLQSLVWRSDGTFADDSAEFHKFQEHNPDRHDDGKNFGEIFAGTMLDYKNFLKSRGTPE